MKLKALRGQLSNFMVLQLGIFRDNCRAFNRHLKLLLLNKRPEIIAAFSANQIVQVNPPKVFVTIAHITSVEESNHREKAEAKVKRLKETIDSILTSLAHCELTIVISTLPNRHITAYLPDYQLSCIQIKESPEYDPMFIGFRIQDELIDRVDEFEWFLFTEDDILINDSYFLKKLENFNKRCGYGQAILLPNRYEMWEGTKRYIDLTIMNSDKLWSERTAIELEGVKFAECANPHAGFYCISNDQIKIWIGSKREWKNRNLGFGGPRECAATYSLLECFYLYKPHTSNLHFFEVRHYDTKYSQLYPQHSPYALLPVKMPSISD
jgi:hypothetical protein